MRLGIPRVAAAVGGLFLLSGCAAEISPDLTLQMPRVDPVEAAENIALGTVAGAAIGGGLGAVFALDPGFGAALGAEGGAGLGAVLGLAATTPIPAYKPITVQPQAVIPNFYDAWPPGYHPPPASSQVPPPRPG